MLQQFLINIPEKFQFLCFMTVYFLSLKRLLAYIQSTKEYLACTKHKYKILIIDIAVITLKLFLWKFLHNCDFNLSFCLRIKGLKSKGPTK